VSGLLRRLDAWQRSRTWLAFPFAVVKKFGDDQAGNLAALIAYYAIFSIFPLLLALSTVVGFVLHGHPDWQDSVTNSALKNVPMLGKAHPFPLKGSVFALVVGLVLAMWSGLGVAKSAQTAFDTVYLVPKSDRPKFPWGVLRALRIVVIGGLGLIATTAVSSAVTSVHSLGDLDLGPGLRIIGIVIAIALNTGLFLVLFRWLTVRVVTWRGALPGAIISAVALQGLQLASTALIAHKFANAKATYGNFAAVIVLMSWFYLQAQVVLLAAEVNVVRQVKLWPRALTDSPSTEADYRAYEAYAEREQYQADEEVNTEFAGDDEAKRPATRNG
jgi:YihY family inner membrane protein